MDYSQSQSFYHLEKPAEFSNKQQTEASTPNESCRKALNLLAIIRIFSAVPS
jgi:hypothetical protein